MHGIDSTERFYVARFCVCCSSHTRLLKSILFCLRTTGKQNSLEAHLIYRASRHPNACYLLLFNIFYLSFRYNPSINSTQNLESGSEVLRF